MQALILTLFLLDLTCHEQEKWP